MYTHGRPTDGGQARCTPGRVSVHSGLNKRVKHARTTPGVRKATVTRSPQNPAGGSPPLAARHQSGLRPRDRAPELCAVASPGLRSAACGRSWVTVSSPGSCTVMVHRPKALLTRYEVAPGGGWHSDLLRLQKDWLRCPRTLSSWPPHPREQPCPLSVQWKGPASLPPPPGLAPSGRRAAPGGS